jgi:aspartate/tyrosine/aromatic aminotransferase
MQNRVAVLQSLSGTGSLRLGAAFIAKFLPGTTVYVSNPTWGNHNNIFADAGVKVGPLMPMPRVYRMLRRDSLVGGVATRRCRRVLGFAGCVGSSLPRPASGPAAHAERKHISLTQRLNLCTEPV